MKQNKQLSTLHLVLAFLVSTLLPSCGNLIGPKPDPTPDPPALHEKRQLSLSSEQLQMAKGQNAFALNMLALAAASDPDFMLSPVSADMVLAMLAAGAEGETRDQLIKALGLDDYSVEAVNAYHDALITTLPYLDTQTDVRLANALWLDRGFEPKDAYSAIVRESYHATLDCLELSDGSSANVINAWAAEATNNLIKEVVTPSQMNDYLRMVIANALYFKGYWEQEFEKENTFDEPFTLADGSTKNVSVMHMSESLMASTPEGLPCTMLRLFYKERGYMMDIILPNEGTTLDDVVSLLDTASLALLEQNLYQRQVDVKLPKFTSSYKRTLNGDMQQLGITRLFGADAELQGISEAEQLYLSSLQQFTYIKVDERGTEAAAVTVGLVGCTSVGPGPEPLRFYATRPFFYLIRDAQYGLILFGGAVSNPKAE